MIYEFVIGVGTVFFLVLLWSLLMKPLDMLIDVASNQTKTAFFNETVNKTAITSNYTLAFDVGYFSLFFIVFFIFIWIVKVSVKQSKEQDFYGG